MSGTKYYLFVVKLITAILVSIASLLRRKPKASRVISDDEIALQAEYLCQKYIEDKFARNGETTGPLHENPRFRGTDTEDLCSQDVVKTMTKYGVILENGYPKLYSNVSQKLNFRINFDIVVCGMFTCVCDNILASGITWAKIVSTYAFAAALASDCCQAKDLRTAKSISRWMGQYTHKRLCSWIREHGGWEGFALHFNSCSCIFNSGNKCRWIDSMFIVLIVTVIASLSITAIIFKLS